MIVGSLMMKGGHGQINQLYDINWGAPNHAPRAPQLMSRNYYGLRVCTLYPHLLAISDQPMLLWQIASY